MTAGLLPSARRRRRAIDNGAGAVEYIAVLLLIASLAAAVVGSGIGTSVVSSFGG